MGNVLTRNVNLAEYTDSHNLQFLMLSFLRFLTVVVHLFMTRISLSRTDCRSTKNCYICHSFLYIMVLVIFWTLVFSNLKCSWSGRPNWVFWEGYTNGDGGIKSLISFKRKVKKTPEAGKGVPKTPTTLRVIEWCNDVFQV